MTISSTLKTAILWILAFSVLVTAAPLSNTNESGPDIIQTNIATYETCSSDAISIFDRYIPAQQELTSQALAVLGYLSEQRPNKSSDPNISFSLKRGDITLFDLRQLMIRFFGIDALPSTSPSDNVLEIDHLDGTSTRMDDNDRHASTLQIRDFYAGMQNSLNGITIKCMKESEGRCADKGLGAFAIWEQGDKVGVCPSSIGAAKNTLTALDGILSSRDGMPDPTSLWNAVYNDNWLTHEMGHLQRFNESWIDDVRFLLQSESGSEICTTYTLSAVEWLATYNSYLAMRSAENYSTFALALEFLSRGLRVPEAGDLSGSEFFCSDSKTGDLEDLWRNRLGYLFPEAAQDDRMKQAFEDGAVNKVWNDLTIAG